MKIPTHPLYDIDLNGTVRLRSTGVIVPEYLNHNGRRAVKIKGKSHKPASNQLDRLMLVTFKPLTEDKNPEWMSVRYRNDNYHDISIENLEWDETWYHPPITPGLNVPADAWIPVYGYPILELRFVNGEVVFRHAKSWREIGSKKASNSDHLFVTIPGTQKQIGVHRLVALTLLPHPIDTYQLVVNHRDSNPKNNYYRNLEWATYSDNNFHAYSEGPRGETIRKILIKSIATGEELLMSGYHELARYVGDSPQGAHQVMERRKREGQPYRGYICKYEDDPRTWTELKNSGTRATMVRPEAIAVKDMRTGEVTIYKKFSELLRKEEIRDHMVYRLINNKVMVPWRGKCFQAVKDDTELKWPQYPEVILSIYEQTSATDKPIKVTDNNGDVKYYTSVTAWSYESPTSRPDPAVISRLLKRAKGRPCRWNGWILEHIDLSKYQWF